MEKKRSVGVMAVGSLLIVISLFFFIWSLIVCIVSSKFKPFVLAALASPSGITLMLQLIAGIGILYFKNWARELVLWVAALYLIVGALLLFLAFVGEPTFQWTLLTILVISFGIFLRIFFTRPKVKEQFK